VTLDKAFLERFASAAVAEGLADATFGTFPSPIGKLVIVQTGAGVCRIAFAEENEDSVLSEVASQLGPRIVAAPREIAPAIEAVLAYLAGETLTFDLPIDMSLVRSEFQRKVLTELQRVGRGHVATYGALAARIGKPRAVRATGTALARNPIPIVVPCHRVLPAGGGLGNYGGGVDRKRWLLTLEGAPLSAVGR
jgi:methylated-DNA-[protein]-cysteine S-methyltransferase